MLIALVVSSILTAGVYQVFHTQQNTSRAQAEVVKMQQNMRAGSFLLARELRSAGFDPSDSAGVGFATNFPKIGGGQLFSTNIDYTVDSDRIAFSLDSNGNGVIDDANNERIAYQLNGRRLERYNSNAANPAEAWEPVIDNVDALNFVYLNANGNVLATNDPAQIRAIQVSLLLRTDKVDGSYTNNITNYLNQQGQDICPTCQNDHFRRRLNSSTIHIRNL
jgi:type IV pilus assembly protein PilW